MENDSFFIAVAKRSGFNQSVIHKSPSFTFIGTPAEERIKVIFEEMKKRAEIIREVVEQRLKELNTDAV
jgi:hypothetical protein